MSTDPGDNDSNTYEIAIGGPQNNYVEIRDGMMVRSNPIYVDTNSLLNAFKFAIRNCGVLALGLPHLNRYSRHLTH